MGDSLLDFRFLVERTETHTNKQLIDGVNSHRCIKIFGHNEGKNCSATFLFLQPYKRKEPEWNHEKLEFKTYLPLQIAAMYSSLLKSKIPLIFEVNFEDLSRSSLYLCRDMPVNGELPIDKDTGQILTGKLYEIL